LGLCVAGATLGDEPAGSWWSRHFGAAPAIRKEDKQQDKPAPAVAPSASRTTAKDDWIRRTEVCDRLEFIAFQTGDAELMRKVQELQQRVADAHARQMKAGNVVEGNR
jgi:hypothetical protein